MTKTQVIKHFGGVEQTAAAVGRTGAAIRQWPAKLSPGLEALVIVAALKACNWRLAPVRRAFPSTFED